MPPISRGFSGRPRRDVDPARVPPGQYVVDDFPVLSAGPTPRTPLDAVEPDHRRRRRRRPDVELGRAARAARRDVHDRHPLRHEVVEARHDVDRRLARHAARGRRDRGRVPDRVVRRRLHDEPHDRGRQRRQGVDRLRLRGRAARPRARRPGAAARPAPVLLEERQVGPRASRSRRRTSPASGRPPATTTTATRGGSSGTGATDRRPGAGRLAPRARARDRSRPPTTP